MKYEIVEKLEDVLNEGGMLVGISQAVNIHINKGELQPVWIFDEIPDNIESLMLDWLEEHKRKVYCETTKLLIYLEIDIEQARISFMRYGNEAICMHEIKWTKTKPRQVAIAEACVFVYKEQNNG